MSNKIKILHVEDDADIREITQMSLMLSDKFDLVQCEGGHEALKTSETFRPDVLLLDVMMPAMSGTELLVKLRLQEGYADIPAIFMTARVQKTEQDNYLAAGAVKVIVKPFDPMTLADEIIEVI